MKLSIIKSTMTAIALTALVAGPASAEDEHVAPMKQLASSKVAGWAANPVVVAALNAQNGKHASLTQDQIIKMDKAWRAEVKSSGGDMTKAVLGNELSAYLKKVKAESDGLYTEIFVMDNKGLNVGQSDVTSDSWQGDEAKWQKTYSMGPKTVHVGKVSTDESSQALQSQLSMTITDPATGKAIGAITVGVNVEMLVE
jgi:hypothetical protein